MEGENKMCSINIPFFKDILIMSFFCDFCGARDSEVKSGGEITKKGKVITLKANCVEDMKRELFKSDTAGLTLPDLELEL